MDELTENQLKGGSYGAEEHRRYIQSEAKRLGIISQSEDRDIEGIEIDDNAFVKLYGEWLNTNGKTFVQFINLPENKSRILKKNLLINM